MLVISPGMVHRTLRSLHPLDLKTRITAPKNDQIIPIPIQKDIESFDAASRLSRGIMSPVNRQIQESTF